MEIGVKVKRIREIRNYSQEYMAEKLGISQEAYSRLETGNTKLDLQRMQQIAAVLEVDPLFLMSFNDNMVFYNNSEYNQGGNIVNHYHSLAETERKALLNRIQQLEKENDALRKEKEI